MSDCRPHLRPLAAFADGPVADTAEPVAADRSIEGASPDRHDADAVRCAHRIDPKGTTQPWLTCVGRKEHTAPHWWSLIGERAWEHDPSVPHV